YDVSGPTHHCLEDISIIRTLPNITLFSPSDWLMAQSFLDYTIDVKSPKYVRLEGKPLPRIYDHKNSFQWAKGFYELAEGDDICIVSNGYTTHIALELLKKLQNKINIGIVDVFLLKPLNEDSLFETLKKYQCIVTLEEAFVSKGGLDSIVSHILNKRDSDIRLRSFGFEDQYLFKFGSRNFLYNQSNFDKDSIIRSIIELNKSVVTT
ncbi:MAG: transketolase C-terminal domain-containing protein, partial [Planctomycetota bacterium]